MELWCVLFESLNECGVVHLSLNLRNEALLARELLVAVTVLDASPGGLYKRQSRN